MLEDTYGHTSIKKAFEQLDVYGIGYDEARATRRRVRLGIIGAGGVSQSKYLPALARLRIIWEPVDLVAFAEPRAEQGRKVEAIYGGRWYADYRHMLAEEQLDAVLVLGPDDLHAEHSIAAMEAGCDVLCEKPISRSLVDADRMVRKGEELGRTFMTVAMMRYSPPYRRAKRMITDGVVADPELFVAKFNLGYDYVDLFESGTIHLFDLTGFLMGDVARVQAVAANRYGHNMRKYPLDAAVATLNFTSGAIGSIYTTSSALSFKPWMRVEVYGDHKWLAVEDQYELIVYDDEMGPAKSWKPVMTNTLCFDEEFGGYMGLVENFLQVVRGNEKPVVVGRDGYRAYELAVACQLSIARDAAVTLPLDPKAADEENRKWLKGHGWTG